jgi:predicted nucleic acid-binding protein
MRLYLDAAAIIYAVEGAPALQGLVAGRITETVAADGLLLTSRLSRLETRVRPLREGRTDLLARYDEFFTRRNVAMIELSAAVVERATGLRARYGFKTPDALHLASAIDAGAEEFLTGDSELARCPDLRVEVLRG